MLEDKPVTHPAKFSDSILESVGAVLPTLLPVGSMVIDPFAGTGKGPEFLASLGYDAWGTELEPEWANQSHRVWHSDFFAYVEGFLATAYAPLAIPAWDGAFTSPAYGNRMADRDMRPSVAGTYAKSLDREASAGSSCHLQWGKEYRQFHRKAWAALTSILRPGAVVALNVKNHIRAQVEVPVSEWHSGYFTEELGYTLLRDDAIITPSLRRGENGKARVESEHVYYMERGEN